MGGMLLAIAIVGSLTSLFIRKVPASGSRLPMQWNPFGEVWVGVEADLSRPSALAHGCRHFLLLVCWAPFSK